MLAARMAISAIAAEVMPRPALWLGANLAAFWRDTTRHLFDRYRPEQHYMRGPGPKWRAKHGQTEAVSRQG